MVVDFHHHYTPPELMESGKGDGSLLLDETGVPKYRFNPLLADLSVHVRMMDKSGIDAAVLSCGSGFDQPKLTICRLINDRLHQAERDYRGRFIGLAHVPALDPREAGAELKRCAVELGFPGIAIASEVQGQPLDAPSFTPLLAGSCRPRALCLHPSAAATHRLDVHGCGRPLAHARLGIFTDGGDGTADQ